MKQPHNQAHSSLSADHHPILGSSAKSFRSMFALTSAACLALGIVLLTSPLARAQASAGNPYKAVAGPQADAEMALVQAKKLTENKMYSVKIPAAYQAIITTLTEVRNAEKAKPELDQNKARIEDTLTEELSITANWQVVQLRIPVLEASCLTFREQITSQLAIFTGINGLLDLFKKSEVDVETLIPLYNQVIENINKIKAPYQKLDAELKNYLTRLEDDLAAAKTKFAKK
ncbi:MAG: hypothetical protein WCI46_03165 [Verrucomicrobiota bacterium]